jgi:hypothetical protein
LVGWICDLEQNMAHFRSLSPQSTSRDFYIENCCSEAGKIHGRYHIGRARTAHNQSSTLPANACVSSTPAADTLLRPLGVAEERTRSCLLNNAYQQELPFSRFPEGLAFGPEGRG